MSILTKENSRKNHKTSEISKARSLSFTHSSAPGRSTTSDRCGWCATETRPGDQQAHRQAHERPKRAQEASLGVLPLFTGAINKQAHFDVAKDAEITET